MLFLTGKPTANFTPGESECCPETHCEQQKLSHLQCGQTHQYPLISTIHHIYITKNLVCKVQHIKMDSDETVVSFNVTFLFTFFPPQKPKNRPGKDWDRTQACLKNQADTRTREILQAVSWSPLSLNVADWKDFKTALKSFPGTKPTHSWMTHCLKSKPEKLRSSLVT